MVIFAFSNNSNNNDNDFSSAMRFRGASRRSDQYSDRLNK